MAKKYKVEIINGIRMAVAIEKNPNRPKVPSPVRCHSGRKDYNRQQVRLETRKILNEMRRAV